MSDAITITIPSSIVNEHLPLLIEKLCDMSVHVVNDNHTKNDIIKDIVAHLYVDCQLTNTEVNKKLLACLSNNAYVHFIQFLNFVEQYETEHCVILEYLSQQIDAGIYASMVEDDNFNQQLVDALVEKDDKLGDLGNVLRSYNSAKHYTPPTNTNKAEEAKVDNTEKPNMANMDNEKFESILQSLGLDEAGLTKARKIKADVESGQPLNMPEMMSFAQEYKSNIDAANLDIPKLMSLIFSPTTDNANTNTTSTSDTPNSTATNSTPPFDMNSIMNMMAPLISNFTNQPKGKGRGQRQRRR